MKRSILELVVPFDPSLRLSWNEGGGWPHLNHFHFHESVASAYYALRGYAVLTKYWSVGTPIENPVSVYQTQLFRKVVGKKIASYLEAVLGDNYSGQPDLFVFRMHDEKNDPKIRYIDPDPWFWVEVKGIHNGRPEAVLATQKRYWNLIAGCEDIEPWRKPIRILRAIPAGADYQALEISY